MIDARTYAVLQDIVRRESRSLLQYVGEAFPWTTPEARGSLTQVQKLVAEERQATDDISRFLFRQHLTPPYLGSYPSDFTTINFVSLEHLLPLLTDAERRAVADLERDVSAVGDPAARGLVQKLLDMKRQHLKALDALAGSQRQPALR
ncbi:MAG TPA: hypothetical protein VG013_35205 [Gemmataceae bacterium]|nr:hypothetical protein [Gemmataceae bacterium]